MFFCLLVRLPSRRLLVPPSFVAHVAVLSRLFRHSLPAASFRRPSTLLLVGFPSVCESPSQPPGPDRRPRATSMLAVLLMLPL